MTEIEFMRNFGNNLKNALEDSWMTQKELSEEIGLSEPTISGYINGTRMPSLKTVINISVVLDYDLTELVDTYETIE